MAEMAGDPQSAAALEAIRMLSADYRARLPARLDEIEQVWRTLSAPCWNEEAARDLHRAVHGVTGSARIFGLPEVSDAARALESDLQALLGAGPAERTRLSERIPDGLRGLRAALGTPHLPD